MQSTPHESVGIDAKPIKSQETVARALRWNVATGVWKPGTPLPSERELATELRVGRATLRAAIDELRSGGLLVTSLGRHGGTRVAESADRTASSIQISNSAKSDIALNFEFRCALEPEAAALAARRATPSDLAVLRELLDTKATSVRSYRAIDSQFHIGIAAATGNPLIKEAVARSRFDFFSWADALWLGIDNWDDLPVKYRDFALSHRGIFDLLADGDAEGVRTEVLSHLVTARDSYVRLVDELGTT